MRKLTKMVGRGSHLSTKIFSKVDETLRYSLPGPCYFCLAPALAGEPWCSACYADLPWNDSACHRCAEPLPWAALPLCGRCLSRPPRFASSHAALRYEGVVVALIRRFKFNADPRAGQLLVQLMRNTLAGLDGDKLPQAVMALPAHHRRARERGFDQALWLAKRLARDLELPHYQARRHRHTPTQRGLDRRARQRNVRGAFTVEVGLPSRIAIIDDIMTTGASLDALAMACLKAGAKEVEVWAIARTPLTI